jgi:protein TonB
MRRKNNKLHPWILIMKTLPILILLTLMLSINASGQKTDTTYFDSDWKPSTKLLSSYFRITKVIEEGKKYKIADYYKTGELQMMGNYSSIEPEVREGMFNWYYKNGLHKSQRMYKSNNLQTEKMWDDKGKLTFQKQYQASGHESLEEAIQKLKKFEKTPKYPGGMEKMYAFIKSNFVMPKNVKYSPGRIFVRFSVDQDGSLLDHVIAQGIHPLIDEEALRVVKLITKMEPAVKDGENVKFSIMLPITIR